MVTTRSAVREGDAPPDEAGPSDLPPRGTSDGSDPSSVPPPTPTANILPALKTKPPETFHGDPDPSGVKVVLWMTMLSVFFDAYKVTDHEDRLRVAVTHLRDTAVIWWDQLPHDLRPTTWDDFKEAIRSRFAAVNNNDYTRGRLRNLTQRGSAQAYAQAFQQIAAQAPLLDNDELRSIYMAGLKEEVKMFTAQRVPATFHEAVSQSIEVDNLLFASRSKQLGGRNSYSGRPAQLPSSRQPSSRQPTAQLAAMNTYAAAPLVKLTDSERDQLLKTGGCFRCRQPGHVAAQCPGRSRPPVAGPGARRLAQSGSSRAAADAAQH